LRCGLAILVGHLVAEPAGRAADLIRPAEEDMFRWGSRDDDPDLS